MIYYDVEDFKRKRKPLQKNVRSKNLSKSELEVEISDKFYYRQPKPKK